MSRHRKMGAISTQTILLIAGGAAAVYFLTRPKTTAVLPPGTMYPGMVPASSAASAQAQASEVNTAITAGSSALQDMINTIWG